MAGSCALAQCWWLGECKRFCYRKLVKRSKSLLARAILALNRKLGIRCSCFGRGR
ncbi:30S ribosomal protein S17 [Candidatus Hodgkinia cicadicola]|nr:30S ribosomal protein S17 [Candidatus Hodgkinia cicadicola]